MTLEEYKQLMSDYGFSVEKYCLASSPLHSYCIAFCGDTYCMQKAFAVYDTDNGEATSYTNLFFNELQGICVVKHKTIETKDINALRPVVINIAEQYKNLLVIQKKEEIKKDFENE